MDHLNGHPILQANALGAHPTFAKDWLSQNYNGEIARKKTMLAIDNICRYLEIPLVFNDSQRNLGDFHTSVTDLDLARDLMHNGVKYQQFQATYMFEELKIIGF
jgi:hypothetical protein